MQFKKYVYFTKCIKDRNMLKWRESGNNRNEPFFMQFKEYFYFI